MIPKRALKNYLSLYTFVFNPVQDGSDITKFTLKVNNRKGETVAKCVLCKHNSEKYWNIGDAYSRVRGLGKMLYYCCMDFVYPNFIQSDMCGCNDNSIRIWRALENVDYVESFFETDTHWEHDEMDNCYTTSLTCRFSFNK